MTVYQRLLDEGPFAMSDVSVQNRIKGIAKFNVDDTSVWYIVDEHTEVEVLEAWIDANDYDKTSWSVYQRVCRQGPQWRRAAKDVFDVTRNVQGGFSMPKHTCSLCGKEDITHLAKHLPECPNR